MLNSHPLNSTIGLLASGGLDSCILLGDLLRQGRTVQPFYIRTGVTWQEAELASLRKFLAAVATPSLLELVLLDLPLADLYAEHWSISGAGVPRYDSPDEAVFLPGRNALLLVKPAVWCQLHGIRELALAPLGTSPFADAGPEFLASFQAALNQGGAGGVELVRPFARMNKRQVMTLGHGLPLELTFSCISPISGQHCGRCNKCAERQAAFQSVSIPDRTHYALPASAPASTS